jgi:hypothetical protein
LKGDWTWSKYTEVQTRADGTQYLPYPSQPGLRWSFDGTIFSYDSFSPEPTKQPYTVLEENSTIYITSSGNTWEIVFITSDKKQWRREGTYNTGNKYIRVYDFDRVP